MDDFFVQNEKAEKYASLLENSPKDNRTKILIHLFTRQSFAAENQRAKCLDELKWYKAYRDEKLAPLVQR